MGEMQIRPLTLNFGPQHPAAHGVLRLVHRYAGLHETVERVFPAEPRCSTPGHFPRDLPFGLACAGHLSVPRPVLLAPFLELDGRRMRR